LPVTFSDAASYRELQLSTVFVHLRPDSDSDVAVSLEMALAKDTLRRRLPGTQRRSRASGAVRRASTVGIQTTSIRSVAGCNAQRRPMRMRLTFDQCDESYQVLSAIYALPSRECSGP